MRICGNFPNEMYTFSSLFIGLKLNLNMQPSQSICMNYFHVLIGSQPNCHAASFGGSSIDWIQFIELGAFRVIWYCCSSATRLMLLWSSSANSADLLPAPSAVLYRQMHSGDSRHSTLILSSGTEFKSALIWLDVADLVLRLTSSQFAKLVEKCDENCGENCSFPLLHGRSSVWGVPEYGIHIVGFKLWVLHCEIHVTRSTLWDPYH